MPESGFPWAFRERVQNFCPYARRAETIIAGWAEQKTIREIMLFLHAHGVGISRAVRIYKTCGTDAERVISENPYHLARDIRSIDFRAADQIAQRLGIGNTALPGCEGIDYALAAAMDEGHCGLPAEELATLTEKLIEVPAALLETALALEIEGDDVVADTLDGRRCIFLSGLHRAEREIAERLRILAAATCSGRRSTRRGRSPGSGTGPASSWRRARKRP